MTIGAQSRPARRLDCTPKELAVATGLSVALTLVWLLILPAVPRTGAAGDTTTYLAMAADPKATHWAPLAFRVLMPWLAHSIGGAEHYPEALKALSLTSQALIGPAVYLITRRFSGGHAAGLLSVAGLMCLPLWTFLIFCPYLIDPMAMLTMVWTVVALVYGWSMALPALLVLMGLARETVVGFALPVYMWLRTKWIDLATGVQVAFLIAPAVIVVWAIRQPMEFTGYHSTLGLMYAGVMVYVRNEVLPHPVSWLIYGFSGSLGIYWALAVAGRRSLGRLWWLLVPVMAQWAFGSDWARYALYAFPVVMPAAAILVWRHRYRSVLLILMGLQSVAVAADLLTDGAPRLYQVTPSNWVSFGLTLVTALVLWLGREKGSATAPRQRMAPLESETSRAARP